MSTNTLICLANDLDFVFRVDTSTIHQKSSPDDEVMMTKEHAFGKEMMRERLFGAGIVRGLLMWR